MSVFINACARVYVCVSMCVFIYIIVCVMHVLACVRVLCACACVMCVRV